ncbi:MAG: hypothetical protein JWN44_847 [Myxococcales bacterium]|nr:hypothetical protein [Myxococcales bacterium]
MRAPARSLFGLFVCLAAGCLEPAKPLSTPPVTTTEIDPMPSPPRHPSPMPNPTPTPTPTPAAAVRIAAGAAAAYTDPSGHVWAADASFTGGVGFTNANAVAIAGTDAAALYNSERYGDAAAPGAGSFSYAITVPAGAYTVRLGFAELYVQAAGQRLFNVSINGQQLLTAFDIFAAAGGMNSAVVRSFPVTAPKGQIQISFDRGSAQNPKVNTLEILPADAADGGT